MDCAAKQGQRRPLSPAAAGGGGGDGPPPARRCSRLSDGEEEEDGAPEAGCGGRPGHCDPNASERNHFLEVCHSCLNYYQDAMHEVARLQAIIQRLPAEDLALWGTDLRQWMAAVGVGIDANSRFLQMLPTPDVCGAPLTQEQAAAVCRAPLGHRVASRNASKVRTTLRQFVRDWAVEGQAERDLTYTPLIEALGRHLPLPPQGSGAPKPKVLCPGSGLGRLPFDLARLGYSAQGNEFSYHMILGSHLIYNRTDEVGAHAIFPFILSTVNRSGCGDNLRLVRVPDVCPCLSLSADSDVSMAAGEFVSVYEGQLQAWDAVATSFFLDTAKNVFLYVRTIASVLRPGGVWTNLGPLLYHYADVENEMSIELSWEEVRPCICSYFDIVEEERRSAHYTLNRGALMRTVFNCVFFSAIRNSQPVTGKSNPVY